MQQDYSLHHRKPRSRGGRKTVEIPTKFHEAWHIIFENLFGDETEEFVRKFDELLRTKDRITSQDINLLRNACRK